MKDSCTIAGAQDNNFASNFQLDENYETTDNTLSIPSNNRQEINVFQAEQNTRKYINLIMM